MGDLALDMQLLYPLIAFVYQNFYLFFNSCLAFLEKPKIMSSPFPKTCANNLPASLLNCHLSF